MRPQKKNQDDAISPVVGVMLMIVVTVVIAAVITVFATGVMGDESSTTPVAMIELENIKSNSGGLLTIVEFVHKGGDPLLWENVEVSLVGDIQTITNYFPGVHGNLTMSGKSGTGVAAEAGDYIRVTVTPKDMDGHYSRDEEVIWTMYDKRTDGILASGSFIVP